MESKYLIGLIPCLFILMIACFADATPMNLIDDSNMNCHTSLKISKLF